MSVRWSLISSDKEVSFPITAGCFGDLLDASDSGNYHNINERKRFNTNISDAAFVVTHCPPDSTMDEYSSRVKYAVELMELFPTAFQCVEYLEVDDRYKKSILNNCEEYSFHTFSFDLSYPKDTVWFCMNLIRLVTRDGYSDSEMFELFQPLVGTWASCLIAFGVNFSRNALDVDKRYHQQSGFGTWSTCLWVPRFCTEDEIRGFCENPENFIHKCASEDLEDGLQPRDDEGDSISFISKMFGSQAVERNHVVTTRPVSVILDALKIPHDKLSNIISL